MTLDLRDLLTQHDDYELMREEGESGVGGKERSKEAVRMRAGEKVEKGDSDR